MLEQKDKAKGTEGKTEDEGAKQSQQHEGVRKDKGCGHYPLSDLQFDVVTLVYEKSKALQAYDKYLLDSQPCEELRALFERIAADDKKHVEELKNFLGKS